MTEQFRRTGFLIILEPNGCHAAPLAAVSHEEAEILRLFQSAQISVSACLLPLPRNVVEFTLTLGRVARADAGGGGAALSVLKLLPRWFDE